MSSELKRLGCLRQGQVLTVSPGSRRSVLKTQKGQALVEMAIVLPLLLVLLLAVGYFGHAVISVQNLHAGARSASRAMALASTETPDLRRSGSYEATSERFLELSQGFLDGIVRPTQLLVRPQTRLSHDYNSVLNLNGRFERLNEHRFAYVLTETVDATSSAYNSPAPQDIKSNAPANLRSLQFGMGAVYYGGTLQYSLDELTPLGRFIFRFGDDPVIRIGATALMPAELPLRGTGYGLLEINPWLGELIGSSVEDNPAYPDLIED